MNNYDYFEQADSHANNFSNANGWDNFGSSGYDYMDNGGGNDAPSNANPSNSLPYVFIIANSTASDVTNVVILGATSNTVGATNNGNVAAITITMDSGLTTYSQLLESIKTMPFTVGEMHLQSSNASQPYKALTFTQGAPNGTSTTYVISPKLDPLQNQSTVSILRHRFVVDSWTKISTTILASATLTMSMYPMNELNVSRGLDGKQVEKNYAQPNLSQYQNLLR